MDKSGRQSRVEQLLEQGYSAAEAQGRVRAEEAGYQPLPAHGVDKPGTNGVQRPGARRES
jgi:hypothetical protein